MTIKPFIIIWTRGRRVGAFAAAAIGAACLLGLLLASAAAASGGAATWPGARVVRSYGVLTATETLTATATFTATNTPTPTGTAAVSATETATPTDTATPEPTTTDTPEATPTDTATATPSDTPTPTSTSTSTETETPTPTATGTPRVYELYVPAVFLNWSRPLPYRQYIVALLCNWEAPTPVPTSTPTLTPTPLTTATPTPSNTNTPTPRPTQVWMGTGVWNNFLSWGDTPAQAYYGTGEIQPAPPDGTSFTGRSHIGNYGVMRTFLGYNPPLAGSEVVSAQLTFVRGYTFERDIYGFHRGLWASDPATTTNWLDWDPAVLFSFDVDDYLFTNPGDPITLTVPPAAVNTSGPTRFLIRSLQDDTGLNYTGTKVFEMSSVVTLTVYYRPGGAP